MIWYSVNCECNKVVFGPIDELSKNSLLKNIRNDTIEKSHTEQFMQRNEAFGKQKFILTAYVWSNFQYRIWVNSTFKQNHFKQWCVILVVIQLSFEVWRTHYPRKCTQPKISTFITNIFKKWFKNNILLFIRKQNWRQFSKRYLSVNSWILWNASFKMFV